MATAARLAAKGARVEIFEAGSSAGGKVRGYQREGFVFDLGPSLLTLPAVVRELFTSTGRPVDEYLEVTPIEPAFKYFFADGVEVTIPGADPSAVAQAFGDALGGRARSDWLSLSARGSDIWELTRKPVLQSPIDSWFDLVKLAKSLRDIKTIAPWQTLAGAIAAQVGDERLRQVVSRYATYSGSNPWLAPAALLATPYIEEAFGVWHISGGVFKLATALQDRCEELGVVFHFDQPVSAITTVNSSATGVVLADGSNPNADFVVSNIDAGLTYHLMPNEPKARSEKARIKNLTPSFSGFTMSLALRGKTPGLAHHNVFFPRDYQKEFQQLFEPGGQPVKEPAIYVCSPNDPSMRPGDDFESWFVLVNAPLHAPNSPGGVDWRQPGLAKSYAADILVQLAKRGHDVRQRIIWQELSTPADLEEATGAPGGAIYGAANHGAKATFLRPKNQSPIKNLYLVGGSAHPGGGVPLVLFSAAITANLIAPSAFVTQ
jgi:phytoene desaturase